MEGKGGGKGGGGCGGDSKHVKVEMGVMVGPEVEVDVDEAVTSRVREGRRGKDKCKCDGTRRGRREGGFHILNV